MTHKHIVLGWNSQLVTKRFEYTLGATIPIQYDWSKTMCREINTFTTRNLWSYTLYAKPIAITFAIAESIGIWIENNCWTNTHRALVELVDSFSFRFFHHADWLSVVFRLPYGWCRTDCLVNRSHLVGHQLPGSTLWTGFDAWKLLSRCHTQSEFAEHLWCLCGSIYA